MKEKVKKILKGENGITLVALVVTIVVLLILAGVSLNLVLSNNGIVNKAKDAKNKTEQDQINTEKALNDLNDWMDKELGSSTEGNKPDLSMLKVGDYVNYTYDDAENYVLTSATSGSSDNPAEGIPQIAGLKWRILNVNDDGTVDLISAESTSAPMYFKGALGYNNGVYLMNDICAKQYSNSSLGVIARSLNIEDIEKKFNDAGKAAKKAYISNGALGSIDAQYGDAKTYGSGYNKYPNLYASQIGAGINTPNITEPNKDLADPYKESTYTEKIITGSDTATDGLTVTQTSYSFDTFTQNTYFTDKDFYSVVFETGKCFWLASRSTDCQEMGAFFGFRLVDFDSWLWSYYICGSNGSEERNYFAYDLRPVVSLGSDFIDIGGGKVDGAWQIKVK